MTKIYVGFDSTIDKVFSFSNVKEISSLKQNKKIKHLIEETVKTISKHSDKEIPIDDFKYKKELARYLSPYEKIVSLGGNAAIESSTFNSLGMDVEFSGTVSKNSIKELKKKNPENVKNFIPTISKISYIINSNPTSFIIQIEGKPSRVILCDGEGRRYNDVKNVIKKSIKLTKPKSYFSLVGWQVSFPEGITKKQENELIDFISELKNKHIKLFVDLGSFEEKYPSKLKRLYKFLLNFDVLSMNETEYELFSRIMKKSLKDIFDKSNLSSFYVHSKSYQWSLSKSKEIAEMMYEAQKLSAAAGTFRIEKMKYPTIKDLKKILKGKKIKKKIIKKGKFYYVKTKTIKPKKILSTVGAGDVSFASLISSLSNQGFN